MVRHKILNVEVHIGRCVRDQNDQALQEYSKRQPQVVHGERQANNSCPDTRTEDGKGALVGSEAVVSSEIRKARAFDVISNL